MKCVVTEDDVERAFYAMDAEFRKHFPAKIYSEDKALAVAGIRAALESFAKTLGEPVAVPAVIDIDRVPSWVTKMSDPATYVAGWNECRAAMLSGILVPNGWKLVPIEPTAEMHRAANIADNKAYIGGSMHGADNEDIYFAMVNAAPSPNANEE